MTFRTALAILAGSLTIALSAPVSAQTPADFTKFSEACLGAQAFLIGELPDGTDPASILTPLCACIVTAFAPLTQPEVDMLAADLRGESTEEISCRLHRLRRSRDQGPRRPHQLLLEARDPVADAARTAAQ